jgi:hypothetical protein
MANPSTTISYQLDTTTYGHVLGHSRSGAGMEMLTLDSSFSLLGCLAVCIVGWGPYGSGRCSVLVLTGVLKFLLHTTIHWLVFLSRTDKFLHEDELYLYKTYIYMNTYIKKYKSLILSSATHTVHLSGKYKRVYGFRAQSRKKYKKSLYFPKVPKGLLPCFHRVVWKCKLGLVGKYKNETRRAYTRLGTLGLWDPAYVHTVHRAPAGRMRGLRKIRSVCWAVTPTTRNELWATTTTKSPVPFWFADPWDVSLRSCWKTCTVSQSEPQLWWI